MKNLKKLKRDDLKFVKGGYFLPLGENGNCPTGWYPCYTYNYCTKDVKNHCPCEYGYGPCL